MSIALTESRFQKRNAAFIAELKTNMKKNQGSFRKQYAPCRNEWRRVLENVKFFLTNELHHQNVRLEAEDVLRLPQEGLRLTSKCLEQDFRRDSFSTLLSRACQEEIHSDFSDCPIPKFDRARPTARSLLSVFLCLFLFFSIQLCKVLL